MLVTMSEMVVVGVLIKKTHLVLPIHWPLIRPNKAVMIQTTPNILRKLRLSIINVSEKNPSAIF